MKKTNNKMLEYVNLTTSLSVTNPKCNGKYNGQHHRNGYGHHDNIHYLNRLMICKYGECTTTVLLIKFVDEYSTVNYMKKRFQTDIQMFLMCKW